MFIGPNQVKGIPEIVDFPSKPRQAGVFQGEKFS